VERRLAWTATRLPPTPRHINHNDNARSEHFPSSSTLSNDIPYYSIVLLLLLLLLLLLRSAAARTCLIPRTHNNFGDRSFNAAGPRVCNSLPPHLQRDTNFVRFKRQLKTFLFGS